MVAEIKPVYGAWAARLRAHGYEPVSALDPDGKRPEYVISEHPVAVKTLTDRPVAALLVARAADAIVARGTDRLLAERGLDRGPCRHGSDEVRLFVLAAEIGDGTLAGTTRDGSVQVICAAGGDGRGLQGGIIPLDGTWKNGTLFDTPRDRLPAITAEALRSLLDEIAELPYRITVERAPKPKPSRGAWLGRAS